MLRSKTSPGSDVAMVLTLGLMLAVSGCWRGKPAVEATDSDTDVLDSDSRDTDAACEYYDSQTYCERFMAEHPPCTGDDCFTMRCLPEGAGVCADAWRFSVSDEMYWEFTESCERVGTVAEPDPYECPDGELQWNVFCHMDPCP